MNTLKKRVIRHRKRVDEWIIRFGVRRNVVIRRNVAHHGVIHKQVRHHHEWNKIAETNEIDIDEGQYNLHGKLKCLSSMVHPIPHLVTKPHVGLVEEGLK